MLAEQERWLLWLPVAMGCGIWLYFKLAVEPRAYAGLYALLLTIPALFRWKKYPLLRAILLVAFGLALGFAAAQFQVQRTATKVLERPIRFTVLQGHLAQIQDAEEGMKLVIDAPEIVPYVPKAGEVRKPFYPQPKLPDRIRLNLKKPEPQLMAGQMIKLRGGLFPLPQPALPNGFDMARHFYFQGIGAVGFGIAPVEVIEQAELHGWQEKLNDIRHRFSRLIREKIPGAEGTIADALITGEQSAIPAETREQWTTAGITHMLSISGLHLSIVAGFMFVVVRFLLVLIPGLALRYSIKKWAALVALIGSFAYLALAGFPVAANRSFVMVALVLGAVMLDRQVLSLRSVALAAILILLWMPESLLGPSFQLSFAATTAIVALYEVYKRTPLSRQFYDWWLMRPFFYLSGIAITSLVATAATAPFVILHFHQFALYPILANVLTSPILSLIVMPAGLLAVALMSVGGEAPALAVMQWGIAQINMLAAWISTLPHAVSYVPPFPIWGIACFTFGALWLCCWRQKWRLAGVPLMVIGLLSLSTSRLPDVVIAPLGEQVAVKINDKEYTMAKGGDRNFIAKIWAESLGIEAFIPAKQMQDMRCDGEGCVIKVSDRILALPKLREAAAEDCKTADAIVTSFYADCPRGEFVFSRPQEAAAIWWDEMRVERARSYVTRLTAKQRSRGASHRP